MLARMLFISSMVRGGMRRRPIKYLRRQSPPGELQKKATYAKHGSDCQENYGKKRCVKRTYRAIIVLTK